MSQDALESKRFDLAVVIPAYNEAECIAEVVRSWVDALSTLSVGDFKVTVLDDGSTDGTSEALSVFSSDPRVEVVRKANSGHGPTILQGYRAAVESAEWVFQCDGDNEMGPDSFEALWDLRESYDAIFGTRMERRQSAGRRLISAVSRLVVWLAYAPGVRDVNTPYRLMRSSVLRMILPPIPDTTFAPNIVIAGTMAAARVRIANLDVPHHNRRTGTVSIAKWRLWRSAARSLVQTLALATTMRRAARGVRANLPAEATS